jgi:hypothetical protein
LRYDIEDLGRECQPTHVGIVTGGRYTIACTLPQQTKFDAMCESLDLCLDIHNKGWI